MEFIDLKSQYKALQAKIDSRIQSVLSHGKYILGPEVFEVEEKLAEFVGVKHAISCANGTDALVLALMALGVRAGDAVFCPTFTFFATAEAVSFIGAIPVFVDSDHASFNLCVEDLDRKVNKVKRSGILNPKAVIAVDLFGLPCEYPEISAACDRHGLDLIEDAAQGMGGSINGKRCGSFGRIATTSFFPAKPLGCYGDGGAVFTDDDDLAERVLSLRMHGKGENKYDNVRIGMNSRMDTLQAAILLEKLAAFPGELLRRAEFAELYRQLLPAEFHTQALGEGVISAWAQFSVVCPNRDKVIQSLSGRDIPTAIYYKQCLHQQPVYEFLAEVDTDFPKACQLSDSVVSLPMHPYMDSAMIELVVDTLQL